MPAHEEHSSAQLDIISKALSEYCLQFDIPASQERESVATHMLSLFRSGITTSEALKAILEANRAQFD